VGAAGNVHTLMLVQLSGGSMQNHEAGLGQG
jgi:hypothetical protein